MAVKFSGFTTGATTANTLIAGYDSVLNTNNQYTLTQLGVGIFSNSISSDLTLESSAADLIFEMDNNAANSANFQINNGAGNNRADLHLNSQIHITMKGQRVGIVQYNPSYTLDVTGDGRFTSDLTIGGNAIVSGQAYSDGIVTLTPGATVTPDWDDGNIQSVILDQVGVTMANPSNIKIGATYILVVVQDGTGSRTITTWGTAYEFPGNTAPTLTTTADYADIITLVAYNANTLMCTSVLNFAIN
jgi:hypothetical protein